MKKSRKGYTLYCITYDGNVKYMKFEHKAMSHCNATLKYLHKSITITVDGKLLAEWRNHKLVHYRPLEWEGEDDNG